MSDIVERLRAATARAERLEAALNKLIRFAQSLSEQASDMTCQYEAEEIYLHGVPQLLQEASGVIEEARAALSPAPSEGGDGWQDIASAPRDGTQIQIWQEGLEPNQYVAAFDEGWSNGGWWLICDGKNTEIPLRGPAPTHWRHVFAVPAPHHEGK